MMDPELVFWRTKNDLIFFQTKNYISFIKNDNKKLKTIKFK